MSRSYRKPFYTCTPQWDKDAEHKYRRRVKQALAVPFDPDRDWEEVNLSQKGIEEYGTKWGFEVPPDEDSDNWDKEHYEKMRRK